MSTVRTPRSHRLKSPEVAVGIVIALLLGVVSVVTRPSGTAPTLISTGVSIGTAPVTVDPLPTAQIDGVAWSQVVSGNTVFVGGQFQNARPAGSAPGQNLQVRKNLMSYDITTGNLTSWAPRLNAQARVTALSPDGKTLYVGGDFTVAAQKKRTRIAAFDVATGNLITTFAPQLDAAVKAIYATNSTVFVGGSFTTANGKSRNRLAAFTAKRGVLLNWNPSANATVAAIVLTPDRSGFIIGGSFTKLGGIDAYGMGRVEASTGKGQPWAINQVVRNAGLNGSVTSLSTDGTNIYGTGFAFSNIKSTFEGMFAANPTDGSVVWIEDCHGDSYSAFPQSGVLYVASHAHDCERMGGFPQTAASQRATAFTTTADRLLTPNLAKTYVSYQGYAAPSLLNWFPLIPEGTYTGQKQAAWNVTGNSDYVVYGGEFPSVNNVAQQGLVRFGLRGAHPNGYGPERAGDDWVPDAESQQSGSARVGFQMNWDRDDATLNYEVLRQRIDVPEAETTVWSGPLTSTFYDRPFLQFGDTGMWGYGVYEYRIRATDSSGNSAVSARTRVTVEYPVSVSNYRDRVRGLNASFYWRLGEAAGTTKAFDWWGGSDGIVGSDVDAGVPGAVDGGQAYRFNGAPASNVMFPTGSYGPESFTVQAFVQTYALQKGEIIGFGDSNKSLPTEPLSAINDRTLYLQSDGTVAFGTYDSYSLTAHTLSSPNPINDGVWHQITGTFTAGAMNLYVDGVLVASRTDVAHAANQYGYWQLGGDRIKLFTGLDKSLNFQGNIDEAAVYPTALSGADIAALYALR